MKHTMISLAASLLLIVGLATTRSLLTKQNRMEKKLIVTRREAQSKNQTDAMTSNLTDFHPDLANMSIPSYLKKLYINFTLGREINTVRTYENQAESKYTQ